VKCLRLEVVEQVLSEVLLQTVRVEPEQALQAVPIASAGVLERRPPELVIHPAIEVFSQEERPEPEQCIHLLTLTHTYTTDTGIK
jgi:hypothetical protein